MKNLAAILVLIVAAGCTSLPEGAPRVLGISLSPVAVALEVDARQRLLVSGAIAGREVDVTHYVKFYTDKPAVAVVDRAGQVRAVGPGEVVVDFGCGAGIDVVLAAHKVGTAGNVVGVDMTPHMIERAKQSVAEAHVAEKTEFLLADLEQVELPNGFADVVISNCVINLCPDKEAVYREAFRVLKPGGRLAISDIVYGREINPQVRERFQANWAGCVGGAIEEDRYFQILQDVGFGQVEIVARHPLQHKELEEMACCPGPEFTPAPAKDDIASVEGKVVSIKFRAGKPRSL